MMREILPWVLVVAALVLIMPLVVLCVWTLVLRARMALRRRPPAMLITRIERAR